MKKKVALLVPHHFNLYESIIRNLEINNFELQLILITDKAFKYKNFKEKFFNFVQKIFLGDREYKFKLSVKRNSELLQKALKKIDGKFDFTLVIRPDYFTLESLQELKDKSSIFTAYQWDGFERYPNIINYIELFDRFFVFDKDDYFQYKNRYSNLHPTSNFYIDYFEVESNDVKNEVFFLGSYLENRIDEIISITDFFKKQKIESNVQIVFNRSHIPDKLKNANIKLIPRPVKYADMIENIKKSKYLLEFQNTNIHNGLSFRVFEALCFKKKLITNNKEIRKYDFYHPNNILVWENQNYENILSFVDKEYVEIDPQVYNKYSFTNWIHYIFDEKPYQSINFPEN